MTKSIPCIYLCKESIISPQSMSMLQLWLLQVKSKRHFPVSWKPPSVVWEHLINWWCWEIPMLGLAGSTQCGLVWLDFKGSATVTAMDYWSSQCVQNSNCASPTQCSDCQTSSNAHGCIPIQKAGISLTMSSLDKETFLTFKSPGWSMELSAQQIIEWCGHSFVYQSNLHAGWMLLNHLKSLTPSHWSTMSVLMLWDPVWKLLSADRLRTHQTILLSTGMPSKKWSTMLP